MKKMPLIVPSLALSGLEEQENVEEDALDSASVMDPSAIDGPSISPDLATMIANICWQRLHFGKKMVGPTVSPGQVS